MLAPMENATAGKDSRDHIEWSETLLSSFSQAQEALRNPKTITIPKRSDMLVIANDGATASQKLTNFGR